MGEYKYQCLTKSQLSKKFNISLPTLNKWLDRIPELTDHKNERIFTPKQVELIFLHLGEPAG